MVLSIKTNIFYDDNNTKLSYISLLISIVLNKLENFQLPLNKFIMTNVHAQIAAQTTTVLFLSQVVRLFPAGCQAAASTGEVCSDNTVSGLLLSCTLHMKIFPLAAPTVTYSESGVKQALVQSEPTWKPLCIFGELVIAFSGLFPFLESFF